MYAPGFEGVSPPEDTHRVRWQKQSGGRKPLGIYRAVFVDGLHVKDVLRDCVGVQNAICGAQKHIKLHD
jgi:hypothetical protein